MPISFHNRNAIFLSWQNVHHLQYVFFPFYTWSKKLMPCGKSMVHYMPSCWCHICAGLHNGWLRFKLRRRSCIGVTICGSSSCTRWAAGAAPRPSSRGPHRLLKDPLSRRKNVERIVNAFSPSKILPSVTEMGSPLFLHGVVWQVLLHPDACLLAEVQDPIILL